VGKILRQLIGIGLAATMTTVALAAEDSYFSMTEIQLHADFDREPIKSDIWTLTVEHFSEWKYGDNFYFLDIESKPDFETQADSLYFEYAPRFSLDKMFNTKILPGKSLGELYATVQYNDSDRVFINQVWLYGISFDFAGQPNFGFSNIHLLVREEQTQKTSYQFTFVWGQPFHLGTWEFSFNGFLDYWEDDEKQVLLTEPQLRVSLSNFVGKDNFLSKASIGTEIEISQNFFGKDYGWEVNPTVFFVFPF
jgi:nucleoside-specific outer membrane channel protein Tsx